MSMTADPDSANPTPGPTLGRPDDPTRGPDRSGPTQPDAITAIGTAAVAMAAIALSFMALTGLGRLAGWGHLSPLLPLTVDAYGLTATRVWLTRRTRSARVRRFAAMNAVGAILASVAGNAVYHAVTAHAVVLGSWKWVMVVLVSAVPPVTIGLVSHLVALRSRDTEFAAAESAAREHVEAVGQTPTVGATNPTVDPTDVPDPAAIPGPKPNSGESGTGSGRPDTDPSIASGTDGPDPKLAEARALDERWLREKGRHVGAETIRTELGVGQQRSRELRDAVRGIRALEAAG